MKKLKLIIAVTLLVAIAATVMLTGCAGDNDKQPLSLEEIFITESTHTSEGDFGGPGYGVWRGRNNGADHFREFDISSLKTGTEVKRYYYIRLFFNYDNVFDRHYDRVKLKVTASQDVETLVRFQDFYYLGNNTKILGEKRVNFAAGVPQEVEVIFNKPIDFTEYNYINLRDVHIKLYDFSLNFFWTCDRNSAEWVQWSYTEYTISDFELVEVVD